MKIVAIIQARMGSTRLPGKVMKEVLGKPLLEYQINRVRRSKLIDEIVIATTTNEMEQPIIDVCQQLDVPCYRGSELDVLSRYFEAALEHKADIIVRLTSDCPLIDPSIIDAIIAKYLLRPTRFDYVSNTVIRTYPRGLDVEVFSFEALAKANQEATCSQDREHVTPFIYRHPDQFSLGHVTSPLNLSSYRLTVDTKEDLELITRIIHHFHEKDLATVTLHDVIQLLHENPAWSLINSHIEQKKLEGSS